jgi:tRNA (guanine-N7-)-methyltransferase
MKLKIKNFTEHLIDYSSISFLESLKGKNVILDIGCGEGEFITELASRYPKKKFIGLEIKYGRIMKCLKRAKLWNLYNLGFSICDATIFMNKIIPNESLNKVFVNNPDPWPKEKHHKNRLVNSNFLNIIYKKLKRRGNLYIKTDDKEYYRYIKSNVKNTSLIEDESLGFIDNLVPLTKFQELYIRNEKKIYSMKLLKK